MAYEEEKIKKAAARKKQGQPSARYEFGKEAEREMARPRAVQSGMNWKPVIIVFALVLISAIGIHEAEWLKGKITDKVAADQKCAAVQERVAIAMERAFPAPLPGYTQAQQRGLEEAVNEEATATLKLGAKKIKDSVDCLLDIPKGHNITEKDMDTCEANYQAPQIIGRRSHE